MIKPSDFKLRPARREDAPDIARAVLMAVGEEIATALGGSADRRKLVDETFERTAARDDSQYSYRNAIIAEAPDGSTAGVIVAYDGARLHDMRPAFCEEANAVMGYNIKSEDIPDETTPDEIYLDSLAVWPEWRGNGLARRLIEAAVDAHRDAGKPVGLLCDPDNDRARRLYESLGFRIVGMRPFAGVDMHHMLHH